MSAAVVTAAGAARRLGVPVRDPAVLREFAAAAGDARARLRARVA